MSIGYQLKRLHHYLLSSIFHPLFLVWLLALPAITPLLQPTLTRSADGLLHLYRMVALDFVIRQGVFFSRWLPDLAYGYGLPLFVFYAPLSYYVAEGLHLLGLSAVGAFNSSAALALLISTTGVYLLVKDLFGPRAGVLAGVAYVYAPYQLFNTFSRGSLPVTWAGALFPFVFWAFSRLIHENRPGYVPVSALICGAALLMHNISNLLFLPLLLFYLVVELLFTRITDYAPEPTKSPTPKGWATHRGGEALWPADDDRREAQRGQANEVARRRSGPTRPGQAPYGRTTHYRSLRVGLALALGLALAAFFWLPATLERELAQIQRVITPPDFDYRSNFVSLSQLFSLPRPANTGLLNPTDPLTLGLAQVALAVIGLLALFLRIRGQRNSRELKGTQQNAPLLPCPAAPLLFAIIALPATVFMMLPISVGVWDRLPLIAFVQQPHRLLSVTAFLLAILAGSAVAALPDRLSSGLTLAGVTLIFITAVPLLYPRYYAVLPAAPTLTGMMAYEQTTGAIGTTSFGEYLPIWVQQTPHESPLEPMYQTSAIIERLDRAYLPPGANVESAAYGFNQVDLTIDAPEPYQAVFHTFYFPGWQASVDAQSAPLAPVTERGLIGVTMPAGRHRLQLSFGETPIRLTANVISILALIIVIMLKVKTLKVQSSMFNVQPSTFNVLPSPFTLPQFAIMMALALTLILAKTLYLDRYGNPLKHTFTGTQVAGADVSRQVNFGQQVNLLGYDLNRPSVASGQTFDLTLYWQARQPLTTNYSALAQLVDDQQHLYAGQDNLHPGNLPTSRWEPWGFAQDAHAVRVPPGTPPGDYFLVAGLYDPATWARLPVLDGGDPGWSDVIAIPVTVTRPANPPTVDELGITWPIDDQTSRVFAERTPEVSPIRLLGATPEREMIQRNDFLRVALFWEAVNAPVMDYQVSLRLLAADGAVALVETSHPSFGRYPTSRWVGSERVRDNHALWIPPDFPTGVYQVQIQWLDEAGQPVGDWVELGQLMAE